MKLQNRQKKKASELREDLPQRGSEKGRQRSNKEQRDDSSKAIVGRGMKSKSRRFKDPEFDLADAAEQQEQVNAAPAEVEEVEKQKSGYEGDASFNLYLREIGQTKLLTPDQEAELAERIQKGDKDAREEMIKANLRLVVKIARDYEGYGLPLLDLVNEGNIGLMKAVERFDPKKGAKLSTYSAWWIKQSIKRALANQSKTIRLPVHMVEKLFNMRRVASRLQDDLGREPTDEELAAELEITPAQVNQWRSAASRPSSLEAPIGDDDTSTIGEIVPDDGASTPYQQLEGKATNEMLETMIETLEPREATILKYRFGLAGENQQTLEEIGDQFGVTRERIRQIQMIALEKLRKMFEKAETVSNAA